MAPLTCGRAAPWAGVIGATLGWFISQQAGATAVFAACATGRWWSVALLGLLGLACAGGGALVSWRSWRADPQSGRGFVGLLSVMVAALLGFPILLQTIGGLIVPGCVS